MTTIRRLSSSIMSALRRTSLDTDVAPVASPERSASLQAVEKVRRGFSDESDFGVDGADALLASFELGDVEESGSTRDLEHQALRVFSGESSFEASAPRYGQLLGAQLPSSLGAPRESGIPASSRRSGASAPDASDILSPDQASWELQNLDASSTQLDSPEDLLSLLGSPGTSSSSVGPMDLDLDFYDDSLIHGLDVPGGPAPSVEGPSQARNTSASAWSEVSVEPAGPHEFLADLSDLGTMVPDEPGPTDAAFAGVLGSLAANPVAASIPATAALGAQSVDAVAETVEPTSEMNAARPEHAPASIQDAVESVQVDPSLLMPEEPGKA
ncbi:hypothetical protein [Myxococcus landrumensis]|uniref:Uncharacterized protein n=1 Tax=Myxococcus landrumensis TaxID=2813577 RepID=A0ABX7NGY6_9BACT|nr:hypothetical protein [Myxococcus landrumus]QSQ18020.1 hypothetical protein JY572_19220 [Myxococcus landrumus]